MSELRDWNYFRYEHIAGFPSRFYRRWRDMTEELDVQTSTWVPIDRDRLLWYISNAEVTLSPCTLEEVEAATGVAASSGQGN